MQYHGNNVTSIFLFLEAFRPHLFWAQHSTTNQVPHSTSWTTNWCSIFHTYIWCWEEIHWWYSPSR